MSQVERQRVMIWSEGSRVAAEIFKPSDLTAATAAILLCQGWGGKMSDSEPYPLRFAKAGYICMTFDYRTWGDSDGKMLPAADAPILVQPGEQEAKIRVVREVVDPLDQIADVRACLAYLITEEGVDRCRLR